MAAAKLKGNPRYGTREEAAGPKTDMMISFPNVAGAQLRKQFKIWKKTKKKKKSHSRGYPVLVPKKPSAKKAAKREPEP